MWKKRISKIKLGGMPAACNERIKTKKVSGRKDGLMFAVEDMTDW